jgi:UDP-N-acetyl-D-glucosamine dehydrogenase
MTKMSVIGLGYVGLPLAVQAAEKGYTVQGVDVNKKLVAMVNERHSPYVNDQRFADALARVSTEQFTATTSYDGIEDSDAIVICVPTPTENNVPDITLVRAAAQSVGEHLQKGQLVVLESTVNPGVTRDEVLPLLEEASGLKVGTDFCLAHCPERIDPGNDSFYVGNLNRVVGGITSDCTTRAAKFYQTIIDAQILPLGSVEEAEFVKSWENSHRNVMIALANSAAIMCDAMNMSIDNVLLGLQSKVDQFGLKLAQPGIGVGGHCIPEDIHYIINKARQSGVDTRFLDTAADLNDDMPRYAVHQLQELTAQHGERLSNLNVAMLGLAYKPNISDKRRSPAIEVAHQLVRQAGDVKLHDPYVRSSSEISIPGGTYCSDVEDALNGSDVLFVGTAHSEYVRSLKPRALRAAGVRYVYDGRNCLDRSAFETAGIVYKGIGR